MRDTEGTYVVGLVHGGTVVKINRVAASDVWLTCRLGYRISTINAFDGVTLLEPRTFRRASERASGDISFSLVCV